MGHFSSRFSGNDTNTNNALEIKLDDDDNDEEDYSLRDFDDSEWTPADSSYGAAIPLAGWIPKGLRRSMEWTVIAAVAAMIVVLIVRTSLRAGDNRNSNSNNGVKRYINNDDYDNDDGSIWAYNISNTATDDNDAMDD